MLARKKTTPLPPLTTRQAAEMVGVSQTTFRSLMRTARNAHGLDLRLPEDQWLDRRTPLYDNEAVQTWAATRPGSGRWGPRTKKDD